MKLLLINPKFPESFWSFSWALKNVTSHKRTINSPLGLATLAALAPSDWDIEIVDENVEPINWSAKADIIGVCGMGVQAERQKEILAYFKNQGMFVVAGGSYASLCPEEYAGLAHSVIAGEAEYIWPKFCKDYLEGNPQALYQETGTVSLHDSPRPRFDLLKIDRYQRISLQFSRGCPFQCEFCDIIVMFGRTPRNKTVEQVGHELDLLRSQGVTQVFFVDDNFIGNKKLAKDLLRFLIEYQEKHNYRFNFGTEASVNLADDETLLQLIKQANFEWVFMGIESPSEESLKETKKFQNAKGTSLLEKIQTIYGAGLDILAGFIVGFDADDKTIFERQYQFIESSGIIVSMVGLLTALPKTPLYKRLQEEGRLMDLHKADNTRAFTNVVPKQMTTDELVKGYMGLHRRLAEEKNTYRRIANKVTYLKNPAQVTDLTFRMQFLYVSRLFFKGILPGGPQRIYYFFRSLLLGIKHPANLPMIISDWVAAISLKSFARRYFEKPVTLGEWAQAHFQRNLIEKLNRHIREPILFKISEWQGTEKVWIEFKESFDRRVSRVLLKSTRQYLRRSQGSIVLDFRSITDSGLNHLKPVLNRLEKYGHQVHLYLTETSYQKFQNELTAFHYTLVPVRQ